METIIQIFAAPVWNDTILALLHTLWQALIVCVFLWAFLKWAPAERCHWRYRAAMAALAAVIMGGLLSWSILRLDSRVSAPVVIRMEGGFQTNLAEASPSAPGTGPAVNSPSESQVRAVPMRFSDWIPVLSILWVVGVMIMLARIGYHFAGVQRICRSSWPITQTEMNDLCRSVAERLRIRRRIRLAASSDVVVPSVLGLWLPVILFPASMMTGVPVEQWRAILAHELAHVRRHDYLMNWLQELVEAALFFNPGVWWISRQIRLEREACCDADALEVTGTAGAYARALTDWVGSNRLDAVGVPLPALSGGDGRSGLVDRVRRVLFPRHRPGMRIPWLSFFALLAISLLLLAGLGRSTEWAVGLAAEWLTPAERIERMAHLAQTHGQRKTDAGDGTEVWVRGVVRTESGQAPPESLMVHLSAVRSGYQGGYSCRPSEDGRFEQRVSPGQVQIMATADGFAPGFAAAFQVGPTLDSPEVEIVLEPGFSGRIRLVDPAGEPIPGVQLTGRFVSTVPHRSTELKSGEDGEVLLPHATTHPMRWEASAEGYQYADKELELSPDSTVSWTLEPARPTRGRVVAQADGRSVPDAEIRLLGRTGAYPMGREPDRAPVLARTDADGAFVLRSLPDRSRHLLFIVAPGYAPEFVHGIMSGQDDIEVRLGPELFVTGTITGDLERLRHVRSVPSIYVSQSYQTDQDLRQGVGDWASVTIRDGVGHFELRGLWKDIVRITAGDQKETLYLTEPVEDLVIHLGGKAEVDENGPPQRPLVVRLEVPDDSPPPKGELIIRFWGGNQEGGRKEIAVENGEARTQVPADARVGIDGSGLIGYWMAEEQSLEPPPGTDPWIISRPVIPAGSIYGRVVDEKGEEVSNVLVSPVEVEASPMKKASPLNVSGKSSAGSDDGPTRFVAQPLPLGGTYIMIAWRGQTFAASEKISLTEEEPFREITLTMPAGRILAGRVVDEQGLPVHGVEVLLDYSTPNGHGFSHGRGVLTGADGEFEMEAINPDVPGHYTLHIEAHLGYQPLKQRVQWEQPIVLNLSKGARLEGTVLEADSGNPVSGVDVYAFLTDFRPGDPAHYQDADAPTDQDGRFSFTSLQPGRRYQLHVRQGSLGGRSFEFQTGAGFTGPVELRMEIAHWARDRVQVMAP